MSFQMMAKAIKQTDVTTIEKFILLMLANYADDTGWAYPSIATLAENCCCNPSTVRRALKSLGDKNIILTENRIRTDGSQTSNLYKIYPEEIDNCDRGVALCNPLGDSKNNRGGVAKTVPHEPII
jgi:hypothetical protein